MQKNRFPHARRILLFIGASLLLGLAGCQSPTIVNLTPDSLAENPSHIYTISARIAPHSAAYVKGSVRPRIIIDGNAFPLNKSPLGQDQYEFEYQVPAGRTEVAYYFLVTYQIESDGIRSSQEEYSEVRHAQIVGRYVLSLEVNRGPVGARVSVLGRGFTPNDVVYFDNVPVRTSYESPNSVSFYVPAVEPNRNYLVSIGALQGQTRVGPFRVDAVGGVAEAPTTTYATAAGATASPLSVAPTSLALHQGEKATLTFTTPVTASAGGLLIDVTTDIPESVIMPEVVVPAGSNTVTVTVEGGRPGSGSLFAKGAGVKELAIPVSVK